MIVTKGKQWKNQSVEEDELIDPLLRFGFGVVAYRNLLESLMSGFCLLCFLVYPIYMIYTRGDAYGATSSVYSRWSLGNLGYSTVQCQLIPLSLPKMAL